MNEYIEALKRYVAEKPSNYGSDANSILEMLYRYYHQYRIWIISRNAPISRTSYRWGVRQPL